MQTQSHIVSPSAEEVARVTQHIREADWIEHHRRLPNHDVLVRMAGCDIFAFPSFDESLGWVAIEALGLGLPVVASNIFAIPEIVEDGVQGLLIELPLNVDRRWKGIADLNPAPRPSYIETHNAVAEGCLRAFDKLLRDPQLRKLMGTAGRGKFEERYSQRVAAARLATLLRQAVM
jgi:starch synthase